MRPTPGYADPASSPVHGDASCLIPGGMVRLRHVNGRAATIALALSTGALVAAGNAVPALAARPAAQTVSGAVSLTSRPVAAAPEIPVGARALGSAAASRRLDFDVVLRSADPGGLQALATAVSVPASPQYRHFLRPAQFAARFGQPRAAIASVDAALRAVGLAPGRISANHLVIPVSTTVGRARVILHTGFERYRLSSGRVALANTSAPQLPATAARLTQAVLGLNNLATLETAAARPPHRQQQAAPAAPAVTGPQACTAAARLARRTGSWTYDQLARAYSFTSRAVAGREGAGMTVALFEEEAWRASDVRKFQACYGTGAQVSTVKVDGGVGRRPGVEATLDIETVIALAPRASLLVYEAPFSLTSKSTIDQYTRIVDDDQAQVLSTSYGLCEQVTRFYNPGLIASENTVFEQAATEGISVLAAAGDSGSEACKQFNSHLKQLTVQDPASQPFVTGVGGTELTAIGPPPAERVWNDARSGQGAGGGGVSSIWPMPSWQKGPGVISRYSSGRPCHLARGYCREIPDLSASADPERGYVIYFKGHWTLVGGTSAATPLCAALVTDIGSRAAPPARAGFLNPLLYSLPEGTFNDIRRGNNDYTRTHHGRYPATRWYDLASGLGSPIGPNLAAALWRQRR
jgi:subtilase family serine protease